MAQYAAQVEHYDKAIDIYEQVNEHNYIDIFVCGWEMQDTVESC